MTNEIKQRIRQIKNSDVPKGYIKKYKYIFPDAWKLVNLGSVTKRKSEKNKDRNDLNSYSINNQVGFIQQDEQFSEGSYQDIDKTNYKVVKPGEFAYNPARVNIGSIGLQKEATDVIISSLYVCFGLDKSCDKTYFENWFKTYDFNKEITRNLEGSVREYLFYENFSNIKLPVPPFEEQQKIAEILIQCDKIIELKQMLIDELNMLKKVYLSKMFPKKGHNVPEMRFDGFTGAWEQRKLIDEVDSIDTGKSKFTVQESGTYEILGSTSVIGYDDAFDYEGDFLLTARVGANAGELYRHSGKVKISDNTVFIQGKQLEFIYHALLNFDIKKLSFGTGQPLVKASELKEQMLFLPSMDEEREKIGEFFKKLDNLITLHQRELEEKQQLKKSLMQLLLTGIVRCEI